MEITVELHVARAYIQRRACTRRCSIAVVDYSSLEQQGIERWKACPPGNAQCRDGGATIGPGYWKQDERGALVYGLEVPAASVSGDLLRLGLAGHGRRTSLQLNSTDGRRTLVYVAMHERKLC